MQATTCTHNVAVPESFTAV